MDVTATPGNATNAMKTSSFFANLTTTAAMGKPVMDERGCPCSPRADRLTARITKSKELHMISIFRIWCMTLSTRDNRAHLRSSSPSTPAQRFERANVRRRCLNMCEIQGGQ